jgi:hypothetical protein
MGVIVCVLHNDVDHVEVLLAHHRAGVAGQRRAGGVKVVGEKSFIDKRVKDKVILARRGTF